MGISSRTALAVAFAVPAIVMLPADSRADVSYAGKTVQMIIASSAGGGKIRAANYLALQAKPDGLTVMQTDASTAQPHSVRRKVSKYDPRKFEAVGGFNAGGSVIFIRKGLKDRLMGSGKPLVVGAISGSRSWQAMTVWGKAYLGWNLRWIPGYKGTRSLLKAIRQGEIDMMATASSKRVDDLLKDGVVELVAQEGLGIRGDFKARDAYPNVPIFPAMLEKKNLPKIAWEGYNSWIGPSQVDKWLALPPKTPKEHVAAYRAAFNAVAKDKKFLKLLRKQFSRDAVIMDGPHVAKIIAHVQSVSDDAIRFARKLRQKYKLSSR